MHIYTYINVYKNQSCKQPCLPNNLTSVYKFGDKEPYSLSKVEKEKKSGAEQKWTFTSMRGRTICHGGMSILFA